uniref:Uncharacterized protein n=1 Tax=Cannabis sativa TaxID=3483 RepID=A0A803P929_CANSA
MISNHNTSTPTVLTPQDKNLTVAPSTSHPIQPSTLTQHLSPKGKGKTVMISLPVVLPQNDIINRHLNFPLEKIMSAGSETTHHTLGASSSICLTIDGSRNNVNTTPTNATDNTPITKSIVASSNVPLTTRLSTAKSVPLSINTTPAYMHLENTTNTNSPRISATVVDSNIIIVKPNTSSNVAAIETNSTTLPNLIHTTANENRMASVFSERQLISSSGNVRQDKMTPRMHIWRRLPSSPRAFRQLKLLVKQNCPDRLDYVVLNIPWTTQIQLPTLKHLDFYSSDHRALLVSVVLNNQEAPPRFKSRFHFEKLWLREPECEAIISNCWKQTTDLTTNTLLQNIAATSSELQSWHHQKFGDLPRKIKSSHSVVQNLQDSYDTSPSHFSELHQSKNILENLLAQEEEYWQQRIRIDWLQAGDSNTKYFHQRANTRKNNNKITSLTDATGMIHSSKAKISRIIQQHYLDIYTTEGADPNAIAYVLHTVPTVNTDKNNQALTRTFTAAEVYGTLQSMKTNSSPGIDGFYVMFYY